MTVFEGFEEDGLPPGLYEGARQDLGVIAAALDPDANVIESIIGAFWPLALIDLPLSFAVDTALLPVSSLWWLGYYSFAEEPLEEPQLEQRELGPDGEWRTVDPSAPNEESSQDAANQQTNEETR